MNIKSLCAAAVVAIGMGQAADAALVSAYKLNFTLVDAGETYDDFETITQYDRWDRWGLNFGETVKGKILIYDDGYGKYVQLALRGSVMFESELYESISGSYSGLEYDSWNLTELWWQGDSGQLVYVDDGKPYYEWAEGELTDIRLAPVPLPATAALLPLGIGALAMMRRRRVRG